MNGVVLIVIYVVIASAGLAMAIGTGLATDQINVLLSLPVFFVVAASVIVGAWPLALLLTKSARFST